MQMMVAIQPPPIDSDFRLDYCLARAAMLETYIADLRRRARTVYDDRVIRTHEAELRDYLVVLAEYGL
jgi:hypothetical protein